MLRSCHSNVRLRSIVELFIKMMFQGRLWINSRSIPPSLFGLAKLIYTHSRLLSGWYTYLYRFVWATAVAGEHRTDMRAVQAVLVLGHLVPQFCLISHQNLFVCPSHRQNMFFEVLQDLLIDAPRNTQRALLQTLWQEQVTPVARSHFVMAPKARVEHGGT